MNDLIKIINDIRRPRLLITAARLGLADYRRERDLRRLIGGVSRPETAVVSLLDEECRLEAVRQSGRATYSIARHIEVLIALLSEARLIARPI